MAPIKFEEHIKDKLNERSIKPSDTAWEAISDTLDTSQKPRKGGFFWYGIAASFIGILILSLWYFNSEDPLYKQDNIEITDTPGEEKRENKTDANVNPIDKGAEKKYVVVEAEEEVEEKKSNKKSAISSREQKLTHQNFLQDTETALVSIDEIDSVKIEKPLWEGSKEIIDTKIAEVVAQVDLLKRNNTSVTDAEVDSILRRAQNDILANKIFHGDRTVDATALLAEVEEELDQSFRNQIFETLKNGYLKVRTAVADRNN